MKSSTKKTLIVGGVIIGIAAGGGFGVGFFLAKQLKPDVTVIVGGDAAAYEADVDAAYAKYQRAKSSGDFLSALTPDELVNVSYRLFDEHPTHYATGVGATVANTLGLSVTQRIYSTYVKVDDRFFEESASVSDMVNIHNRMYEDKTNTVMYWGKTGDYATYTPETVTNEEYAELMGSNVSKGLRYIVSEKTCVYAASTASGDPSTSASIQGDKIVVELELDPATSVLHYVRQMKNISNLMAYPTFDYVHLTVTMDKALNLESMSTHEAYTATLSSGIGSPLEGRIKTVYSSDGNEVIPAVTDIISYPDEL